jgi:DNA-3-methyladenine glycosylase I
MKKEKRRCSWCGNDPLYVAYHDMEWGVPVREDLAHFEHLTLEAFQAGLSWLTILKRRDNFRKAFKGFNPAKVSRFGKADVARLLKDEGIIRNRMKIEAAIKNAKAFLAVQEEFGTFTKYIWSFTGGKVLRRGSSLKPLPATSKESVALSEDLKKRGFSFVGPTIVYAHMQATGLVNDHVKGCFKHRPAVRKR